MQENGTASVDIDADRISKMTSDELLDISTFEMIFESENQLRRKQLEALCVNQAKKLHIASEFKSVFKAYSVELAKELNKHHGGNQTNFVEQPIQLNCGDWICDGKGVRKNSFSVRSDGYETTYASTMPILITEILENIDDGTEKIRIAYYKNGWKSFLCKRSIAASNTKIIDLADYGINVSSDNAKHMVKYLSDLISYNTDIIPRYKATSKMGWLENGGFAPYSDFRFDAEKEYGKLYDCIRENGDFNKWKNYVNEMRAFSKLCRMQIAASFSSVLIEKLSILPWIMHLWGGSGNGKTVGFFAGMSVWGNPLLGKLSITMNNTLNTFLDRADFLNNIPFAGDELQLIKNYNTNYDKLIMSCAEGVGRGRMKYDKLQKVGTWKCVFLFTGEEPITRENSGGGAKNRVLEIECVEKVVKNGTEATEFLGENYGHAGPVFIEAISGQDDKIKDIYRCFYNEIIEQDITTEKQAMAMACLLTGDVLAEEYIFKSGMPALTVNDVSSYLMSVKEVDTGERSYEYILNDIAVNYNRFNDTGGEIWGRIDDVFVLINKQVLIERLRSAGFEFEAVKKKWAENGYLITNSQGKFIHQTKCYGVKTSYIKLKLKTETDEIAPF